MIVQEQSLLGQPSQDPRGDRRAQTTSAQQTAEALFSPRSGQPLREAGPADAAARGPRILAATTVRVPESASEIPIHGKPARQLVIPTEHVPRIRTWLKYGMTAAQVAEMYGSTAAEVKLALDSGR